MISGCQVAVAKQQKAKPITEPLLQAQCITWITHIDMASERLTRLFDLTCKKNLPLHCVSDGYMACREKCLYNACKKS